MSDIIQLLPDSIANQIAAGEVIQRPASVVKELLENAIDAQSKNISVIIKDSGKLLVQVIDDGVGMSETDARMSFERHATSKIKAAEDLFYIKTMGFRGEALASIAAVAQVELKTRQRQDEIGVLIQIEGSQVKKHEPEACPEGTSIAVKNLFYNIPARRNFLKSNPVEMKHIVDEFQRVALAHPEIGFSLYQNDLEVYNLKPGKLSHRIVGIFGKNYQKQLTPCDEETDLLTIKGYLGKPEFAKKTRGEQFFFVNNRFIKSNYLNHAIKVGYEGLIPEDTYPFYVLFIEMDPKHIDVNVHPTKTEVKFDDERTVYGLIRAATKQALGMHNISPSLDFERDTNVQLKMNNYQLLNKDFNTEEDYQNEKKYLRFENIPKEKGSTNWQDLFEGLKDDSVFSENFNKEENSVTFQSAANELSNSEITRTTPSAFQIHQIYIATQIKSGLMLIDQQAAHERIRYERYINALSNQSSASQQSLFPETITLNPADFELVNDLATEIRALGFIFEVFGQNSIVIRGMPADITGTNGKEVFEGLIEQYKFNKSELSLEKRDNMARAMAKQSCIKSGDILSEDEMKSLIDQLFGCENPNYSPNGQLTFFILDLGRIASFFKK